MMQNNLIWMMGGSGSGKSTAAEAFRELGIKVLDADAASREILKKGHAAYAEIIGAFGTSVLTSAGEIDRRRLGKIVFTDSEKLALLNKITHKYIISMLLDEAGEETAVIDAALSPRGLVDCKTVIFIKASRLYKIERIMERDNISRQDAENRINSQPSDSEYESLATVVFENNGDREQLKNNIRDWCVNEKIN